MDLSRPSCIHPALTAPFTVACSLSNFKSPSLLLLWSSLGAESWLLGSTGNLVNQELSLNFQVCEWQPPEQLRQLLDLEMRDTGESQDKLLKLCRDVIHFSVKTSKALSCPWCSPLSESNGANVQGTGALGLRNHGSDGDFFMGPFNPY